MDIGCCSESPSPGSRRAGGTENARVPVGTRPTRPPLNESAPVDLDPEIRSYYERQPEEDRLTRGPSQLEAERTRRLLRRYLPAPPVTVADIGGAAGAYALWLASLGYRVHLLDPVERLVAEARRRSSAAERPLVMIGIGDARALPYSDGAVDAVLLLGPLYHLTTVDDRKLALAEARRVLKPGGVVFAAAISRWASALDGIARDLFAQDGHHEIVEGALDAGQHRNPDGRAGGFTTAYLHRPDELRAEVVAAGFRISGLYGIEGFAGFMPDFDERWADPRQRADMLRLADALEAEPALLGASPHLLAVGTA